MATPYAYNSANTIYTGAAPSDTGLDASHITSNYDLYEAARTGFFTLQINFNTSGTNNQAAPDNTLKIGAKTNTTSSRTWSADNAQKYILLNVTKASVPSFSIQKLEYTRGNEKVYFAGVPEWSEGSITVDDVVGLDTKGILYAWKEKAYNSYTHKGGRMKDYKKSATLTEYTQDYEVIRKWDLEGCWISNIEDSEFDRENDSKRQLVATIIYDRAKMVYDSTSTGSNSTANSSTSNS